MMSIIILVGAYRYYAGLAEKFGKTKWHFGLLAIAIYLGAQFAFGLCFGLFKEITDPGSLDTTSNNTFTFVNLIGWLVSIAVVWGIYKFLERRFEKENLQKPSLEIEEIGIREKQ
ncbi:hypothetical protein [Chryseobacterium tongliaoense]|uniref:hypothetical protein n=1 Tax=Chryseobacterium tongliaoense TaxID=3240933 RepID=UPI0035188D7B